MSGDVDYPQGCLPIVNGPSVSQSQQIERLRKLAGCLYDCKPNNDEEVQQPNRFRRLFAHLSDDCFLDNSNSDFRIYLSLCLANILRVFQPEVPTAAALDLKDVYLHLFRTLRGLGEVTTDSPKFKHYFHLVEAIEKILHPLSEMKDFDDKEAHPVFRSLIKEILSVPCGKAWQKNLQRDKKRIRESVEDEETQNGEEEEDEEEEDSIDKIRKVLVTIGVNAITELDYVPNEILDVLFYHIVSPQRTNFVESRLLAQDIIRSCVESGNNNLAQAIENAITSAGKDGKLPEEFELTGSNSRNKYFEVLRCLHHVSYDLVANAIQEMSFWLQSENEAYRREAVQIVGMITSDRNCQFGMDTNDATWAAFLNAAHDVDHSVRLEFVKQSRNVLTSNHSHLRGQVINSLLRLSTDPVDEVRDDVVSAVTEVAKCKLEVISDKMLKTCADRMKDKKVSV
uniref:Uncharacterized protein n=1 Tax=Caenorhabditis japonica TaxID=281687 RepID=A0A8R1HSL7_CAEJA